MIKPREKAPEILINLVNDTSWKLSEQNPENFVMLIFYRGKHCPVCKKQLEEIQNKLETFTNLGVNIIAISGDTEEKAKATYKEWEITNIPVGFEFSMEDAKKWGLFISKGVSDKEPDTFSEPGFFLLKPDRTVYWQSLQSMPFGRPNLEDVLNGIKYILKENYPARGEA